jgi:hypothetical protein
MSYTCTLTVEQAKELQPLSFLIRAAAPSHLTDRTIDIVATKRRIIVLGSSGIWFTLVARDLNVPKLYNRLYRIVKYYAENPPGENL